MTSTLHSRACVLAAAVAVSACAGARSTRIATAANPSASDARERFTILFRETGSLVSTVVNAPPEKVWQLLPEAYRTLGLPSAPAEGGSGELMWVTPHLETKGPLFTGERTSHYIDCGESAVGDQRADAYVVSFVMVTQLQAMPGGQTRVLTLVDGMARNRSSGSNSGPCRGTGRLEQQLAELLAKKAAG